MTDQKKCPYCGKMYSAEVYANTSEWKRSVHCRNHTCVREHRKRKARERRERDKHRRSEQGTYEPVMNKIFRVRESTKRVQDLFLGRIPLILAERYTVTRQVKLDSVAKATWLR